MSQLANHSQTDFTIVVVWKYFLSRAEVVVFCNPFDHRSFACRCWTETFHIRQVLLSFFWIFRFSSASVSGKDQLWSEENSTIGGFLLGSVWEIDSIHCWCIAGFFIKWRRRKTCWSPLERTSFYIGAENYVPVVNLSLHDRHTFVPVSDWVALIVLIPSR